MSLESSLIDRYMKSATPDQLRDLLPGIFRKGTPEQFQAVMDSVLTELKRRQANSGATQRADQAFIR